MNREDADRLWDFFCRIPAEDKMVFREDVSQKEVVERWAENLDYASVGGGRCHPPQEQDRLEAARRDDPDPDRAGVP
jgi:hypothetical protein